MILQFYRCKQEEKAWRRSSLANSNEKSQETLFCTCINPSPFWAFPLECYLKASNFTCPKLKEFSSLPTSLKSASQTFCPVPVNGITWFSMPTVSHSLHSQDWLLSRLDYWNSSFSYPFCFCSYPYSNLSTLRWGELSKMYIRSSLIQFNDSQFLWIKVLFLLCGIPSLLFSGLFLSSRLISFYSPCLVSPAPTFILESLLTPRMYHFLPHLWPFSYAAPSACVTALLNFSFPNLIPYSFLPPIFSSDVLSS